MSAAATAPLLAPEVRSEKSDEGQQNQRLDILLRNGADGVKELREFLFLNTRIFSVRDIR